jgi:hypothetical protein
MRGVTLPSALRHSGIPCVANNIKIVYLEDPPC